MDVSTVNATATMPVAPTLSGSGTNQDNQTTVAPVVQDQENKGQSAAQMSKEEAQQLTDQFNKFMQMTQTSIQFTLGKQNEPMMVQIINSETGNLIQEMPPKSLQDLGRKVSNYVGVLLDHFA
jgi:flagellar protein FlaG